MVTHDDGHPLRELTRSDIERMPYVDLVALARETNRCPGGKRTVRRIASLASLDAQSRVLEVGCSTGFTSIELATTTRSSIVGIDRSAAAVAVAEEARERLPEPMRRRLTFRVTDLHDLDDPDPPFDLVVAGGATSFMRRKRDAVAAYRRQLRPFGMLSVTNLYYERPPPTSVVSRVEEEIDTELDLTTFGDWMHLYTETGLELYHCERHRLSARPDGVIAAYVGWLVGQPHLRPLAPDTRAALRDRWLRTMRAFNENHKYLGYMLVILRENPLGEQPELFLPEGAWDAHGPVLLGDGP